VLSGVRAPELTENPFLLGLSHSGYVNRILRSIRPNDLEQAVLLLNHDCVVSAFCGIVFDVQFIRLLSDEVVATALRFHGSNERR
jgi:hypothetical protein